MITLFKRSRTTCHKAPIELSSQVSKQTDHPASHSSNRRLISLTKTTGTSGNCSQCVQLTITIDKLLHACNYMLFHLWNNLINKADRILNMANKSILLPQKSVLISSEASSWLFHNFLNFPWTQMSLAYCHHLFLMGWLKRNKKFKNDFWIP